MLRKLFILSVLAAAALYAVPGRDAGPQARASLSTSEPLAAADVDTFTGNPRLVVLSDIGNEPDDQMSLVRLLTYSNKIDIEGLVATTSTWQRPSASRCSSTGSSAASCRGSR